MNPRFQLSYFPAVLLALLLAACTNEGEHTANSELDRLAARAQNVTIIRDDFGVPHIYGKTDADAVFGLLYAQAEDDFNRVERNYIWATGRLAEVDGEDAIFSDLRARLYMTVDEAKAAYAASPDWLKALCDAYADGLNYYLATNPELENVSGYYFEDFNPTMVEDSYLYDKTLAKKLWQVSEDLTKDYLVHI